MNIAPTLQTYSRIIAAAGFGLVVLGGSVCAGWVLHSLPIVRVAPDLEPMKFNTALLFGLLGSALLFWAADRVRTTRIISVVGLLFSGAIFSQHITGVSLGVDTLFVHPFTTGPAEIPGRISPYTSGAFFVLFSAVLARRRQDSSPPALVFVLIACSLVQFLTCAALIGYATGYRLPIAGGTSMAIHTALGLLAASWAVLAVHRPCNDPGDRPALNFLLYAPIMASIFGVVLAMWVLSVLPGQVGIAAPARPVWPAITILAVAAAMVAAALLAARIGFHRAATLDRANRRLVEEIAARERLESTQRLLVAELDHRVRNTLSQVLSLAESTAEAAPDVRQFNTVFGERVRALSRAHSVLATSRWQDVEIGAFLRAVLEPFAGGQEPRIRLSGDAVMIPARATTPLCMVYYELAANAARHGALSSACGSVEVTWRRIVNGAASVEITWQERGGPAVGEPPRQGFGTTLIRSMIPHELGGKTMLEFTPEGVRCEVSFEIVPDAAAPRPERLAG